MLKTITLLAAIVHLPGVGFRIYHFVRFIQDTVENDVLWDGTLIMSILSWSFSLLANIVLALFFIVLYFRQAGETRHDH